MNIESIVNLEDLIGSFFNANFGGGYMDSRWVEDKIKTHDKRLDSHSERLDEFDRFKSSTTVEIKNLIEQIKNLVSTMKWFIGLLVGAFVGFFFYVVQVNILK